MPMYYDLSEVRRPKVLASAHVQLLAEFIWLLKGHNYLERHGSPQEETLDETFTTEQENVVVWAAIRKHFGHMIKHLILDHRKEAFGHVDGDDGGRHTHFIPPLFTQVNALQKQTVSPKDVQRAFDDLHDMRGLKVSTIPISNPFLVHA